MERTITDFAEAVRTETMKKLGGEYQVTVETKNKNNKAVYTGPRITAMRRQNTGKAWKRNHWFIWTIISGSTRTET